MNDLSDIAKTTRERYEYVANIDLERAKVLLTRVERITNASLSHTKNKSYGNIIYSLRKFENGMDHMTISELYSSWKDLEKAIQQAESVLYKSIEEKIEAKK